MLVFQYKQNLLQLFIVMENDKRLGYFKIVFIILNQSH